MERENEGYQAIKAAEEIISKARQNQKSTKDSGAPNPLDIQNAKAVAVEQAEEIINNERKIDKSKIFDLRKPEFNQIPELIVSIEIVNSLKKEYQKLIKERSRIERNGWEEEISTVRKTDSKDKETGKKYDLLIGRSDTGSFFVRVKETTLTNPTFEEQLEKQVQFTQVSEEENLFRAQMVQKDPLDHANIKVWENEALHISYEFVTIYNKAIQKPSLRQRGSQWLSKRFQNKKNSK